MAKEAVEIAAFLCFAAGTIPVWRFLVREVRAASIVQTPEEQERRRKQPVPRSVVIANVLLMVGFALMWCAAVLW